MSTATLTLGISTAGAESQLKGFKELVRSEKSQIDAILRGGDTGNSGILKHIARVKQDLHTLVSEVKLVNLQITDALSTATKVQTGQREASVKEAANREKAFRKSWVKEITRDYSEQSKLEVDIRRAHLQMRLELERDANSKKLALQAQELSLWEMKQKQQNEITAISQARDVELHQMAHERKLAIQSQDLTLWEMKQKQQNEITAISQARDVELHQMASTKRLAIQQQEYDIWKLNQDKRVQAAAAAEALLWKNASFAAASPASRLTTGRAAAAASAVGLADAQVIARYGSDALIASRNLKALEMATLSSTTATRGWNAAHKDAHDVARGLSGALGGLWMTYGQMVPLIAGFAIAASLKAAFTAGKDFEYQMRFVQAVSGDTAKEMKNVSNALIEMSTAGQFKPLEMAQGMRILAQAGMGTADSLATLPTIMALATVGETDLATAAETATGIMHAFGLEISDIGHIGDVIAKAAAISITSVAAMSESMKQASTVAMQYDLSLSEVSASLVALAERNIKGQAAGTAFRNMMNELSNPTQKAQRAFDILGVKMYDGQGRAKNLSVVMNELREEMGRFDQQSRNLLGSAMFGERGNKPFQAIMAKNATEWADMIKKMEESNGFLMTAMNLLENTVEGQFKNLASNVQATFIKVADDSAGSLIDLAHSMRTAFTSQGVIDALKSISSLVIGITQSIFDHITIVKLVAGAYLSFHAGRIALSLIVPVVSGLTTAYGFLATATSVSAAASTLQATALAGMSLQAKNAANGITLLSMAMRLNPWVMAATAIAGVVTAFMLLRARTVEADTATRNAIQGVNDAAEAARKHTSQLSNQNDQLERELGLRKSLAAETVNNIQSKLIEGERQAKQLRDQLKAPTRLKSGTMLGAVTGDTGYVTELTPQQRVAANKALAQLDEANRRLKSDLAAAKVQEERQWKLQLAKDLVDEDKSKSVKVGTEKVNASQLLADRNSGNSWIPKHVTEFDEQIANYSSKLSLITKAEQDQLDIVKAKRAVGLVDEAAYLKQRSDLRKQADDEAELQLMQFEIEQDKRIASAVAGQKELTRATSAELKSHPENSKDILNASKAAEDRLNNLIKKAQADTLQAQADFASRRESNGQQGLKDQLANYGDKYGNVGEQVRNAEEMVRAITVQNQAVKDLTTSERDKNIVAMEGDIARATAFISQLERDNHNTENAVKEKERLVEQLGLYSAQVEEKKRLDQDWVLGAKRGLKEYAEVTTSAATTAADAMKSAFKGMEDSLVEFVTTGKISFRSMANSIISDMLRMAIQAGITRPLANMGMSMLSSFFGAPSVGASVASSAPTLTYAAQGGVFPGSSLTSHRNSIVTKPTTFAFAQGVMGEKVGSPGEAIMPLSRMPGGDLGVKTSGGGGNEVSVTQHITIDARGADAGVDQKIYRAMQQAKDAAVAEINNSLSRGGRTAKLAGVA